MTDPERDDVFDAYLQRRPVLPTFRRTGGAFREAGVRQTS